LLLFDFLPFEICFGRSALTLQVYQNSLGSFISKAENLSLAAIRKTVQNKERQRFLIHAEVPFHYQTVPLVVMLSC